MMRSALATLFALMAFAAGSHAHPRPELPQVLHWGPSAAAQGQGLDVLSYDLALTVDLQRQELRGTCAVEFVVTQDGLEDLLLHLAVLEVDSVTCKGEPLHYVHQGEEVRIDLPYALTSGSIETLSVAYRGHPGHEAWGGFFFTSQVAYSVGVGLYTMPPSMARYWYPCYDDPADKALFDLRITAPAGKTVACGGTLQGIQPDSTGQWWTHHWKEDKPCAPYLASVHVSSYAVISDSIQGLPYRYYVYPEDSLDALRAFAKVPQMEAVYESLFGAYPFSKVAYAETPLSGGMEHQGCITLGSFVFGPGQTWESLIAHELSHMWWGDRVTVADWREVWLSEGFATYCEALWDESQEGWEAYRQTVSSFMQEYFGSGIPDPMYDPPPEYLWSALTYEKGACVLHMLRGVLGDSLFFAALRTYGETLAYGNVTTDTLRAFVEACTGSDMEWFFNEWVYAGGHPVLDVRWGAWPAADDSHTVEVLIQQVQTVPTVFVMPLKLRASGAQDTVAETLWLTGGEDWVQMKLRGLPDTLRVDPDGWVLKQVRSVMREPRLVARGVTVCDSVGGDGDNSAEPGETVEIVVSVTNNFQTTEPLMLELSTQDAWVTVVDGEAPLDSVPTEGQASNADDPFQIEVAQGAGSHTVELQLLVSSAQGYVDTLTTGLFIGTPTVFLVDDDGAAAYEGFYLETLDSLGCLTQVWEVDLAGSPRATRLIELSTGGRAVVWYTGDEDSLTLTSYDQAALRDFIGAGGHLLLTGQDIGRDLVLSGGGADFYQEVLHAGFVTDTYTGTKGIRGVPGDEIGDGVLSLIQGPGGADNQVSPDVIEPLDGADSVFTYYTANQCAALKHDDAGRVVYLAFGFEAVNSTGPQIADRADVLARILSWLGVTGAEDETLPVLPHQALMFASPNPCQHGSVLRWHGGCTELAIYDLTGQLVRRLRIVDSGSEGSMARWDGLNQAHVPVPAGLYIVREGAGRAHSLRLLVVR